MAGRRIKGFFLGVPILSEGVYTEDDRLRRDGFGYAALSISSYLSSDYITALALAFLCLCATIHLNVTVKPSFRVRIVLHAAFSIAFLIGILRSDVSGLALPFAVAITAYYGLMYFTCFDR